MFVLICLKRLSLSIEFRSYHPPHPAASFLYMFKSIPGELGFPFQTHLFPRGISPSLLQPPIPVFGDKSKHLRYQNNRCHKDCPPSTLCCFMTSFLVVINKVTAQWGQGNKSPQMCQEKSHREGEALKEGQVKLHPSGPAAGALRS